MSATEVMRRVRLLILFAATALVGIGSAVGYYVEARRHAEAFDIPVAYGGMLGFAAFMVAITAGAFGLYVWKVRRRAPSIVVGLLMLVPTAWVFVYSAGEHVAGRAGGAGGPMMWIGMPVLALNYVVAAVGIIVDRTIRWSSDQ